jgi:hypothetical protein
MHAACFFQLKHESLRDRLCTLLYLQRSAAGGVKGSEHVTELHSREDLDRFVASQEERVLTVVNLSISSADPCIHIFPAVLALARSFKGYAAFGRCGKRS